MKNGKIDWLVSYPKSGNTWLRSFLTAMIFRDRELSLNNLVGNGIVLGRTHFDAYLGVDSLDLNRKEIFRAFPGFLKSISTNVKENLFAKTHSSFVKNDKGENIFPNECTNKVIYVVRNPLDVCVSFANHTGRKSYEQTIKLMNLNGAYFYANANVFSYQLPQQLGSWSQNYTSWKNGVPEDKILFCRYEDLLTKPKESFKRIATFLSMEFDDKTLELAIEKCDFSSLKKREQEGGFREKPKDSSSFFRKGTSGDWKIKLGKKEVESIIEVHGEVMNELNYLDHLDTYLS